VYALTQLLPHLIVFINSSTFHTAQESIGGNDNRLDLILPKAVPPIQDFNCNWHEPPSTTINKAEGTEQLSGTTEVTVRLLPDTLGPSIDG
jgi:hypothetical protein